jgi:chorismate lyase
MKGELLDLLSPAWRIMLLSDGSVTRHLRLLCPKLACTTLECTRQGPIGTFSSSGGIDAMPADVALIEGDLVQREVLLRISRERDDGVCDDGVCEGGDDSGMEKNDDGKTVPAVYAASWWCSRTFERFMTDSKSPMWTNLRSQNVELYREVRRVYQGDNKELERIFNCPGPFWGRHYIFWHQGAPITVVYEVFNPRLEKQLGPSSPSNQPRA